MGIFSRLEYFPEHHSITRLNGVRWLWWLWRAKEQCRGLAYSSKPTKQGDRCAWRKGCGGAGKKGRWSGYSTRPKSSKESWPEALAEQVRSLGRKHWPSNQGVLIGFIGWAMNKSRPDGTTDKLTDAAYCTIFWTNETQQELGFGSFLFRIFF